MFKWINTAVELQNFCRQQSFPFAFIGGVALQRWGEPRVTVDVDLTLFTGFGAEEKYIQAVLEPLVELKEAPEILERLKKLRAQTEQ